MKGSKLGEAEKSAVAKKLARYTGLSEDYLIRGNLRVNLPQFMKELQRGRGLTTGRLDARFPAGVTTCLGNTPNTIRRMWPSPPLHRRFQQLRAR